MKYCLLSISYALVMLLCSNQLTAQQKTDPKKQTAVTKPKHATPTHTNKATYLKYFVFNEMLLKKALGQVSKQYHVKVNYNNIPDAKVSGMLKKSRPLLEVIEDINIMSGAKMTLKNGIIINQQ